MDEKTPNKTRPASLRFVLKEILDESGNCGIAEEAAFLCQKYTHLSNAHNPPDGLLDDIFDRLVEIERKLKSKNFKTKFIRVTLDLE